MNNKEIAIIKVADVKVGEGRRQVDDKKVKNLIKSIQTVGLINPITVNSKKEIIAGNHRLEAFKALGNSEIPAIILDTDELHTKLIEIDENLIRNSLTKTELDEQILKRKELYEQLHPEATKKAIVKKNLPKRNNSVLVDEDTKPVKTFVEDTAEQTGMSKRSIQQSIQNANNITPEAKEKIKGTPLADKTTFLAKLARTPKDKQLETVEEELKKLSKPKRVKAESKTEKVTVQAEPVNTTNSQVSASKAEEPPMQAEIVSTADNQTAEKGLDIAYKVDFVLRKVAVDGKWLDLPPEYNMDNNSYNNMILVAKNFLKNKGKADNERLVNNEK